MRLNIRCCLAANIRTAVSKMALRSDYFNDVAFATRHIPISGMMLDQLMLILGFQLALSFKSGGTNNWRRVVPWMHIFPRYGDGGQASSLG